MPISKVSRVSKNILFLFYRDLTTRNFYFGYENKSNILLTKSITATVIVTVTVTVTAIVIVTVIVTATVTVIVICNVILIVIFKYEDEKVEPFLLNCQTLTIRSFYPSREACCATKTNRAK